MMSWDAKEFNVEARRLTVEKSLGGNNTFLTAVIRCLTKKHKGGREGEFVLAHSSEESIMAGKTWWWEREVVVSPVREQR